MAIEAQLGGEGSLFVGEDKTLVLSPVRLPPKGTGALVDMTGWTVVFEIRKTDNKADPAALSKTATIVGVFNADPDANTQAAQVVLTDTDLNTVTKGKSTVDEPWRYAWKRMDDGLETVLRYGDAVIEVSAVR